MSLASNIDIHLFAVVASISQIWAVLPFTIQDAFIGCMFIWVGNVAKKKMAFIIEKLEHINIYILILLAIVSYGVTKYILGLCWKMGQHFSGRFLDLGSNSYSIVSLPASLAGCVMVVIVSVLIERTKVLDEFFAFCGKESFLILVLHSIDISMVRYWGGRDLYFLGFTLLGYPFFVYLLRRLETGSRLYEMLRQFMGNKIKRYKK